MRTRSVLFLLLFLLALPVVAREASHDPEETLERFMVLLRQDLKHRRNAALRGVLKLDTQQIRDFAPLQTAYDEELAGIDDARRALREDCIATHYNLTAVRAESLGDRVFRLEKRGIGLREKYFRRISEQVSTVTAVQFLQLQRQFEMLGAVKLSSRTPIASDGTADGASQTEILDRYLETMKKNINASRDRALAEIVRLDGEPAKTFQSIKKEYDKEVAGQRKARSKLLAEYSRVYKELTPEIADSLAARVLMQDNDRIQLREKTLHRMSQEISAVVAVQFLQVQYRFETMADLKAASYVPIAGM